MCTLLLGLTSRSGFATASKSNNKCKLTPSQQVRLTVSQSKDPILLVRILLLLAISNVLTQCIPFLLLLLILFKF